MVQEVFAYRPIARPRPSGTSWKGPPTVVFDGRRWRRRWSEHEDSLNGIACAACGFICRGAR
eukprot:9141363-Lingulodinium_polyedra.AAC.1